MDTRVSLRADTGVERNDPARGPVGARSAALVLCVVLAVLLVSCASTYSGRVAVKGSMPHTFVVLVPDAGGEYRIVGPLEQTIRDKYQNRVLTVEGAIVAPSQGPGMPASLRVDRILKVEAWNPGRNERLHPS